MNCKKAEKTIYFLSKIFKIPDAPFLASLARKINKARREENGQKSEFEFSVVEGTPAVRLLHLCFWEPQAPPSKVHEILKNREKLIKTLQTDISQKYKISFNTKTSDALMRFNKRYGPWPIQIGVEYPQRALPKIKTYLCVGAQSPQEKNMFTAEGFFSFFDFKFFKKHARLLDTLTQNVDVVAIDFLPRDSVVFKFYFKTSTDAGYLLRIKDNLEQVPPIKFWQRFPAGAPITKLKHIWPALPKDIKAWLINNSFKISYLCKDSADKTSFYFR